jgi:hypothetical protein
VLAHFLVMISRFALLCCRFFRFFLHWNSLLF